MPGLTASIAFRFASRTVEYTVRYNHAMALLAGIMLDTKNFVLRTGVRTFEAAAFLRKKGADTTFKRIF